MAMMSCWTCNNYDNYGKNLCRWIYAFNNAFVGQGMKGAGSDTDVVMLVTNMWCQKSDNEEVEWQQDNMCRLHRTLLLSSLLCSSTFQNYSVLAPPARAHMDNRTKHTKDHPIKSKVVKDEYYCSGLSQSDQVKLNCWKIICKPKLQFMSVSHLN